MKITKLGHSCILVQEQDLRILLDPGSYSTAQNEVLGVDIILITQEHPDHLDLNSLQTVLAKNLHTQIFTNAGVGKILEANKIKFALLEDGQRIEIKGVSIEAFGREHATIYPTLPNVVNTGYLIGEKFFTPGDAFTIPAKPVEILGLPVAGPWLKFQEAVDFAIAVKPKVCFPIHDGMLKFFGAIQAYTAKLLTPHGIRFEILEQEKEYEF